MEARHGRATAPAFLTLGLFVLVASPAGGAGYRTTNFTVDAPTPHLAKEIGDTAERCRRELALDWLGKELPPWSQPCPIKARVAPNLGAGGATSFVFDQGNVFGWRMEIQGNRERILDSVVPHEVTHTIFASHFRRPLPRWADEGACTTVEHQSEISKQQQMLIEFLRTRRGIPFSEMFVMTEYPRDVLPLYAQGHSLAKFLIDQQGKRKFLQFLAEGMEHGNWPLSIRSHYGYGDLLTLQNAWLGWVANGRPPLQLVSNPGPNGNQHAAVDSPLRSRTEPRPAGVPIVRGQDPASQIAPSPSPSSLGFVGVDGPIRGQSHGGPAAPQPWNAPVGQQPDQAASPGVATASVYDIRSSPRQR